MSRYVLAIDGGATASRAAVVSSDGDVVGHGVGGPCMPLLTPEARERVARHVTRAVEGAVARALERTGESPPLPVAAVWAGLTGLDPGADPVGWLHGVLASLATHVRQAGPVRVSSDLDSAVEGALGPRTPGVLVYAGTGSVAVGRDETGHLHRAGGHGYLIDDRGGGFDIGRMALRAVVRAWDGRGPQTALESSVRSALRVSGWDDLRRAVYGAANPKAVIASLAPLVTDAAQRGDTVAQAILRDAAVELAELAVAVLRRLPVGRSDAAVDVRFAGGVFSSDPLRLAFAEAVTDRLSRAHVAPGLLPPLGGAALLALDAAGLLPAPPMAGAVVQGLRRGLTGT
ncbi:BadF/BadG/BcrA/BcrD ATPase family protein [Geochorda subterranea]|uniref:BadF/BadG/BcrA/BcrD ATPase family protein n=1 Tax=Geochorda subterranea TaxID=3109564 RepID=A0ABZ1BRW4_9FIRM|nr:BadF/BadG/BcrA/BcrD ATPase family protein [Limnochorda sp. LNt]WRP15551.1 BadF/BadG/BcrA/BcrD ATPase family protein [Limnochorda sp. LNt]